MENDQSQDETARKSEALRNLSSKAALPTAVAKLSGSSRIIPSNTDFHFYNNFDEFKKPIAEIDEKSKILLRHIGASENLLGKSIPLPDDDTVQLDEDLALDWLVSVNDEILERFDVTLDDFKRIRKKEEESGERTMRVHGDDEETGFQKVYGKKDKRVSAQGVAKGSQEVKVATRVPPKVHFHVASLPRPQDVYKIIVNNLNQPFEHVWLEKSADGSTVVHPLEKLNVFDFIDSSEATADPERPLPIEVTPFTFVEDVKTLKQLAEKLRSVDEFAVDLEHNQYRSFQGLTCLMQISTRTEDFVIDTLKLRIHIGPYLRELFKDPTKRKVMHGANSDIFWLQRDFGIYVCNMFDTGQASRVLKMERFSLEHLLIHFCEVQANKVYQNADWRVRPLPHEMIKYAREDTHYLLYIYDRMRMRLLRSSAEPGNSDHPLVEVYKQSYYICTRLYEKELLTDTSYLNIYGLLDAEFNSQQLAIVSGLYQWRDVVARSEDESTGYVLPNRSILDIAKQVPLSDKTLRYVLKTKNPFIERNISSILSIIRHSIQNSAAFEEACEYLKAKRAEMSHETRALPQEESEILPSEAPELPIVTEELENVNNSSLPCDPFVEKSLASMKLKDGSHDLKSSKVKVNGKGNADFNIAYHGAASPARGDSKDTHMSTISSHSAEATVEASKKPSRAFGALFRNSAKRKFNPEKIDKEESKLEQIKSTVSLPFHTFSAEEDSTKDSPLVDIIVLDDDSGPEDSEKANSDAAIDNQLRPDENNGAGSASEEDDDEPMSLSHLSSSFQKCFPSLDQVMSSKVVDKSRPSEGSLEVKPFDYEAARKQVKFGKDAKLEKMADEGDNCKKKDRKKGSAIGKDDDTSELPQGRRRQAFPASGNRSATFKQVS